jgi:hypothetical protein
MKRLRKFVSPCSQQYCGSSRRAAEGKSAIESTDWMGETSGRIIGSTGADNDMALGRRSLGRENWQRECNSSGASAGNEATAVELAWELFHRNPPWTLFAHLPFSFVFKSELGRAKT